MVQVVTSDYLDGKTAKEKGATAFTVLEEFTYEEGKFGVKLQGRARLNDQSRTEGIISLNKTNQRKCAELAGGDTKAWTNKTFTFTVAQTAVEGKLHEVIFVTGLAPTQGQL